MAPTRHTGERVTVAFLGSGSTGNATVVAWDCGAVLIDCGFSAKQTDLRLEQAGVEVASLSALLVTHEHCDHVRGVDVFARKHGLPVHATAGTAQAARLSPALPAMERVRAGEPFEVDGASVLPVRTSHDAAEPVCFVIETPGGTRIGMATDTGMLTSECSEALSACHVVGMEANHDVGMLECGPYPWPLKRRILSDLGHLSNADAAAALESVASERLSKLFALHVSATNNTALLARRALANRARELGLRAKVAVVAQGAAPLVCELGKPRA